MKLHETMPLVLDELQRRVSTLTPHDYRAPASTLPKNATILGTASDAVQRYTTIYLAAHARVEAVQQKMLELLVPQFQRFGMPAPDDLDLFIASLGVEMSAAYHELFIEGVFEEELAAIALGLSKTQVLREFKRAEYAKPYIVTASDWTVGLVPPPTSLYAAMATHPVFQAARGGSHETHTRPRRHRH